MKGTLEQRADARILKELLPVIKKAIRKEAEEMMCINEDVGKLLMDSRQAIGNLVNAYYDMMEEELSVRKIKQLKRWRAAALKHEQYDRAEKYSLLIKELMAKRKGV